MATITPPRPTNLAQVHERVRSPLQRLRKYIRTYVWLESAALFLLFLAFWFWIGLLIDYGLFRLFAWDFVKILPWMVRLGVLIVLAGTATALVATKVFTRLFKEFKDPALALLLERRFPQLLGDRLITAVELSDPEACAKLGFSPAMVRQTIDEAAERVEKLPVREVFDWKRLFRYGLAVVLLTVVLAGAVLGGTIAFSKTAAHGYYGSRNVATIWFERNILLKRSLWDLKSQVVLLEPSNPDLRIARDDPAPEVRVLALKYVIADNDAPEGWRAVTWHDLETRSDLIGSDLPGSPPGDWKPRSGDSITLDDVEARLDRFDVRQKVAGKELPAKWNIADPLAKDGWRALRWSDLSPERLGGFAVPTLSPGWDPSAIPVHAAALAGLCASGPNFGALQAASSARVGPQFQDADLDAIEARLDKVVEGGTTLRFHGTPVHFIQGDVVQRFTPLTIPAAVVAGVGLGGFTGAALVTDFVESKTPRESKEAGLSYIFSRLERLTALRGVVERVARRADEPEMGRVLRELVVPDAVYLVYKGANTSTRVNLKKAGENLYGGTFKDLKVEKTRYWVEAENYESDPRSVEVLPPPTIVSLLCDQYHPAYLYYRPEKPDGSDLRGVKQQMAELDLSSTSGNVTRITQVPAGSDVVLRGAINKKLKNNSDQEDAATNPAVRIVARGGSILTYTDLSWHGDEFRVTFKNVRERQDFTFIFLDENGVKGSRQIEINPRPDTDPTVEGFEPDTVRKTPEGYKITASARIPFIGIIQDGQGLSKVRYAWTIEADEIGTAGLKGNTLNIFGLALKLPAEIETPVTAAATHYRDVPSFVGNLRADFLAPSRLKDMLAEKQPFAFRSLVSRFKIKPDEWIKPLNETDPRAKWKYPRADDEKRVPIQCDFPMWDLGLKASAGKAQKHYKMRLWVEALDTDLDGDTDKNGLPKPHLFATNRFTFRVVSESVLLSEIAREEDELRKKFVEMFETLQNREIKLAETCATLSSGNFKDAEIAGSLEKQLNGMIGSLAVTRAALEKNLGVMVAVRKDYERILRELRVNQVELGNFIDRVNNLIVEPLLQIEADEFPAALKGITDFSLALDRARGMNNVPQITNSTKIAAKNAQLRIQELKDKLRTVLDAMDKIADINLLINKLKEIEASEKDQEELYKRLRQELLDKQLLDLTGPGK